MEKLLEIILSENWILAFILIIIISWLWYWFYKIWNWLLKLLWVTLETALKEFKDLIWSIKDLSNNESVTRELHSDEHTKIIEVLTTNTTILKDIHAEVRCNRKHND